MKEAEFIQETEQLKAEERKRTTWAPKRTKVGNYIKNKELATWPTPIKDRRNRTAQETGFSSGRTYGRAKRIWDSAKQGNKKAQEVVDKIL